MGRIANPKLASLWRARVEGQKRSELSILEYCRQQGFSAANYYAWKRRLHGSRSTVARDAQPRRRRTVVQGPAAAGGFVQFPLTAKSTIEVRFADGTVLSMPAENLAALSVTLQTLQAAQREGAGR